MKFLNFHRKPISMYVAIAFLAMVCFWANQRPVAAAAPAAEKGSTAALDKNEGEGTGFIESEESTPHAKKGKGFPWLIAALVVVAGGAALYFFVLKKKNYTLTVTVGEGVTGTPAAGTSSNKKGTVINYDYSLQSGYSNLTVTLDNAPIAASGTVTMNANHTLAASATKTYVLTVTRGDHVTGTPASGSYSYARGTNVSYNYSPASGYSNLEVKLDNVLVANSGTIAMDNNHTLMATLYGANISVNSTPAGARIFINNVDSGQVTPYTFTYSTAVTKNVLLQYSCGYKEYSESVSVALGQTKTIDHTFVAGIKEDFNVPASSCWMPNNASSWSVTGGYGEYKYYGSAIYYATNLYNYSFDGNYTLIIRVKKILGSASMAIGVFLTSGTNYSSANGYNFMWNTSGQYGIYRMDGYNLVGGGGGYTFIKNWTSTSVITAGLNKWNWIKIVKVGSSYSYYINNTLLFSFTDGTYASNYIGMGPFCSGTTTHMEYEYVYLNLGGTAVPVPASPVKGIEVKDSKNPDISPIMGVKQD
jgi:hypothetical protein